MDITPELRKKQAALQAKLDQLLEEIDRLPLALSLPLSTKMIDNVTKFMGEVRPAIDRYCCSASLTFIPGDLKIDIKVPSPEKLESMKANGLI